MIIESSGTYFHFRTGSQLDFAGLGRIAGDADQAVEQAIGIFCTLPVIR